MDLFNDDIAFHALPHLFMTVFDVLLDFLDSEGKLLPTGIERVGYLFVEDQGKKVHGEGVELAVEVHAKLFFLVVVAGWV